jgi:NodT family efflux transporter outer membrane factor (OMF) lipoprotein
VPLSVPVRFSESGQSSLPDHWWTSFEDPVLNGLVDQALVNNFSLKTAWDRLSQARALAKSAGADLVPTLDAEVEASQNRLYESGQSTDGRSYSLGLAASYELDLWGRIQSSRDAAAFEADASEQDLLAAALTLSGQVAGTWDQLVEQYGQLDILDEQMVNNQKALELVNLQLRTGQVGISDMLQQQLIESLEGERDLALAQAEVLAQQLAILLGYPPRQTVAPRVAAMIDLPPIPKLGLPAELIQGRPDIRSALFSVRSANSDLAAAIADRFPRLSLTAGVTTTGVHTRDLFSNWLATLAANLVAPIVDGGQRKAEVERTRAAAGEALNAYGQTILEALKEVETALVQEQRQRDFIASIDRQLTLAGRVIERLRDRYLQGSVDYQRVLDALLSLQSLQRNRLTARQNLVQYRIDLCLALGTGWPLATPEQSLSNAGPVTDKNIRLSGTRTSG